VEQVARLRPDRVALYGYAHLPERFKPQRRIHAADLPPAIPDDPSAHSALAEAFCPANAATTSLMPDTLPSKNETL